MSVWEPPPIRVLPPRTAPTPYASIRSSLSPKAASLPSGEIERDLGLFPAVVALHDALASPMPQQAALAALLGRAGRTTLSRSGGNVATAQYLRLLARLCEAAATHCEQVGPQWPTIGRDPVAELEGWPGAMSASGGRPSAGSVEPEAIDGLKAPGYKAFSYNNYTKEESKTKTEIQKT